MDSDDSSDDSLGPVFVATSINKRKVTAQKKRVAKGFSVLDRAVERADMMTQRNAKIKELKNNHQLVVPMVMTAAAGDENDDENENESETAKKKKDDNKKKNQTSVTVAASKNAKTNNKNSQKNKTAEDDAHDAFMDNIQKSITQDRIARQNATTNQAQEREHAIRGIVEDLENVMTHERRLALGRARDTELSSVLGGRQIVFFDPWRRQQQIILTNTVADSTSIGDQTVQNAVHYFVHPQAVIMSQNKPDCRQQTRNTTTTSTTAAAAAAAASVASTQLPPATTTEYIKELKGILRLLKAPCDQHSMHMQKAWIQPLLQVLKNHLAFQYFLEQCQLARFCLQSGREIPEPVLVWLLRVACSADDDDDDNEQQVHVPIRDGAMETLQALLRSHQLLKASGNEKKEEGTELTKPHFLSLTELAIQLTAWVPLASFTSTTHNESNDDITANVSNNNSSSSDTINPRGLQRLLSIWCTAFDCDQVSSPDVIKGGLAATQCLSVLVKLGLDNRLRSTECTFDLLKDLKCIISKLLAFVEKDIYHNNKQEYLEWTNAASKAIVNELSLSNLGPGQDGSEDFDDDLAWGCFARACWVLPMMARSHSSKTDCRVQASAVQFKAAYCLETLQHFFNSSSKNWSDDEMFSVVAHCQEQSTVKCNLVDKAKYSLRWRVLCSALVALVKLGEMDAKIRDSGCKCLAAIEIALGRCIEVGMQFYKDESVASDEEDQGFPTIKPETRMKNEFSTAEEARDVAHLLGLIKFQCHSLSSRMGTSLMNGHLTRAGYLVQCQVKYLDDIQTRAAKLGGDRAIVQGSLDSWIKKDASPKGERNVYPGESDDDAESPAKKPRTALAESTSSTKNNQMKS